LISFLKSLNKRFLGKLYLGNRMKNKTELFP